MTQSKHFTKFDRELTTPSRSRRVDDQSSPDTSAAGYALVAASHVGNFRPRPAGTRIIDEAKAAGRSGF